MASGKTLALVTGANQGIGFAISKRLASEHGYYVIMTGRREDDVKTKAKLLQDLGLEVEAHVMEITSDASIDAVVQNVERKFGHLDVLVNNAGIARAVPSSKSVRAEYETLLATNVIGSLSVTEKFLPLLSKSQTTKRVVFVSSGAGSITQWSTPGSPTRAFKAPAYAVSKSAVNALCVQYAVAHEDDKSWKFNCCCPGYCATNLNSYRGVSTPETGAEIICHLATLGEDGPTGTYVNIQGSIPW
ncbi:short chain dehydrogenase reductase [Dactylonectria macrodidyma]|uniref:Short chain dehydrogenase reductase n=1 Tax=Dactylonectria macrodidyma TaxID=307937 RepID=A0A9P9EPZ2_9HYPO|nr:short chain dehydrogenase reductase [Dactylonectria macrodidyma]